MSQFVGTIHCAFYIAPLEVTIFAAVKSFDANITISGNLNVLNGETRLAIMQLGTDSLAMVNGLIN